MPGGDRTGPMGMGPRTGRAAGYCAGYDAPGYANPIGGRWGGRGFYGGGRGGGRGWRNRFYATGLPGWARQGWQHAGWAPPYYSPTPPEYTVENELNTLKAQAEYYGEALDDINRRMVELEKEAAESKDK
ncbi:MAG TPA: DUF5320 domain-containing protein [Acidobacteriota bacterium]|nr:DUF5320 domain-containing protein [Acidobacteriota bacterium]